MGVFRQSHRYLEEAIEYQIVLTGLAATMPLNHANRQITELSSIINTLMADRNAVVQGQIRLHEVTSRVTLAAGRESDIVTLYDCHRMFHWISGRSNKPVKVRFSVRKNRLDPTVPTSRRRARGVPPPADGQSSDTGADLLSSLVILTANLIGGSFEKAKDDIYARYGRDFLNWPPDLQFFRHLRNGCFHGNRFNIRNRHDGTPSIDPNNPPRWSRYEMPNQGAINGSQVVGGAISSQSASTISV